VKARASAWPQLLPIVGYVLLGARSLSSWRRSPLDGSQ
jgi:hypothetical protein